MSAFVAQTRLICWNKKPSWLPSNVTHAWRSPVIMPISSLPYHVDAFWSLFQSPIWSHIRSQIGHFPQPLILVSMLIAWSHDHMITCRAHIPLAFVAPLVELLCVLNVIIGDNVHYAGDSSTYVAISLAFVLRWSAQLCRSSCALHTFRLVDLLVCSLWSSLRRNENNFTTHAYIVC